MERIDIEQARKRAKELLRAWRAQGRPERLADAQREIARGLGFASWPALAHRAEAEAVERAQRHETFVLWATNRRRDRAQAMLDVEPALARAGLDTALLLGDRERIAPALAQPDAPVGHRDWPPLVYVCHSAFLGGERTGALLATATALLDAGADPDAAWQHEEFGALSALYGAAGVAHEPRMTALLLDRGANPDDGESLYHAVETTDHACLRLLLDAGAPVAHSNALGHSLDYDDVEATRLLLEHAEEDAELDILVHAALVRGRSRAHIELLLAHGAAVPEGAATLAVRRGRPDLADLLGAGEPTQADRLIGAIRRGDREEALALHRGLALTASEHDVLVHAASNDHAPAVAIMLELGFPVDLPSQQFGETPLHGAAWYGRPAMVDALLAHGADVNARAERPQRGTPLDWAALGSRHSGSDGDHVATVERLVAAGGLLTETLAQDATEEVSERLFELGAVPEHLAR